MLKALRGPQTFDPYSVSRIHVYTFVYVSITLHQYLYMFYDLYDGNQVCGKKK